MTQGPARDDGTPGDAAPAEMVSRHRYDRERRARVQAETLLEQLSSELFQANERLIAESRAVRAALEETEAMRRRADEALRQQSILSKALAALSGREGADAAMQALLETLCAEFDAADAWYVQATDTDLRISASARPGIAGRVLPFPAGLVDRPRRLTSHSAMAGARQAAGLPTASGETILAPLSIPGEEPGALLLVDMPAVGLVSGNLALLERVADLAVPALTALREARRNAVLVSLLEGRPPEPGGDVLDAPLEAVNRAFARLTDLQANVVVILDSLLSARLDETDEAIDTALEQLGRSTEADRVGVVLPFPAEGVNALRHVWRAPGSEAAGNPPHAPPEVAQRWRAVLAGGGDVLIGDVDRLPDTAVEKAWLKARGTRSLLVVPLLRDETLIGVLGVETIAAPRNFLSGEIHLVRSIAKVVASVVARREAEALLHAAHAETYEERARLDAILSAMPDLIVELDREGRFVTWYSGAVSVPEAVGDAFAGQRVEDVLPPDLAREARAVMAELDAGGRATTRNFPFAIPGSPRRWWQLSASLEGRQGYLFALRDITEAREQTAEIERLSEIARRTTNLVVVTGPDRRIDWVNAAFERTTGWTMDEVRGRKASDFLQCEKTDPETVLRLRRALDAGKPVLDEILNRSKTGRDYWVALDIQPLVDPAGMLHGFMAVETDVTERREQADALRRMAEDAAAARATLIAAVEALQDGFVLYDAEDRLVICNERYRQIYARSAEAIVPGARFEDILRFGLANGEYAEAVGREEDWLAERLERHRQAYSEIEQPLVDGRWLRIFEKATPEGGRVGLRVDITALKQAELRAMADRSAAMEASQDGIAIANADGRFVYMNRAHLEMFGFSGEDEVIGKPWDCLYAPREAEWLRANGLPALEATGRWSGEILGVGRDGRVVDQDVSMTRNHDGGILFISRDIAARRREAAERDRLREELDLAQRREVIGQAAAGLAHDFNNLLATIAGSAALIAETAGADGLAALGARRIVDASGKAAELVKRLMTIGGRRADPVRLDLRRPVQEAAELVRAGLGGALRLTVTLPEAPAEAVADPTDILQLVLNLAINARDAMAGGAGEISITLAPATAGDLAGPFAVGTVAEGRAYLALSVADTGPGMTPEVAAQAFKPYFTTKGDKGTGLGLAVVGSVVTGNGGAIRLQTAPGAGTRFTALWPLEAADEAETGGVGLTGRLDGRTVLVVDDQPEVLDVLTAFLESAGAEVAPCLDPEDALEALREDPGTWDLLVTDFDMAGMTGAELAEAARGLVPGIPAILVTALAGTAGRSGAAFDAVLAKPVTREALVLAAERAILRATPG